MDRDKLKLMVRNLELLVDDIKAEVFSDVESYVSPPPTITQDYDEILEDDDGYPDQQSKKINLVIRKIT